MAKRDLSQLTAIALVLVFLGGGLLLVAPTGSAQGPAVRAQVVDQTTFRPIQASVTLSEAHGDFALGPIQADSSGTAVFHPGPGTYLLAFSLAGYFSGNTSFFRYDGVITVAQTFYLKPYGGTSQRLTVNTEPGASVTVVERASRQVVATGKANATGRAFFDLWSTPFSVMVNKTGRETWVFDSVTPIATVTTTALLNTSTKILGWVRDTSNNVISAGVSAFLFDEDTAKPLLRRLIVANVSGSNIVFDAYSAPSISTALFTIIVAADGYVPTIGHHVRFTANTELTGAFAGNVTLRKTPETTVKTAIQFPSGDWTRFSLTRSVVVSEGGPVEGLPFAYIRDAQLQLALNFATDPTHPAYNAGSTEATALRNRLLAAGPNNLTTTGFLAVNDKTFNNSAFAVSPVSVFANGTVTYGITGSYVLAPPGTIPFDPARSYFINTTLRQGRANRVVNYSYTIQVPPGFDRSLVDAPGVTVTGFTPILAYVPAGPGYTRANIVVKPSKSGDGYGRVIGPVDRFWELNSNLQSYKAIVPFFTDVQFSAQDSTYPNAPDLKAFPDFNYTWIFEPANPVRSTRWAFKPTYNYSLPQEYRVNLTVTYPNGAKSFRTLTIDVDGIKPTVDIQVNGLTGNQGVNQNDRLRFQAANFQDFIFGTTPGVLRRYEWNFGVSTPGTVDATAPTVDWSYGTPGVYTVTLRAVDGAGLKSDPRTVTITVKDTTKPTIVLAVKDSAGNPVTTLMEGVNYTFDASSTTDNFDTRDQLTFAWTFGDGGRAAGVFVVGHTYAQYGNYQFSLAVTDRAGNTAYLNKTYSIAPDFTTRPDITVKDLRVNPRQPQESTFLGSSSVRVSLNATNTGGAAAGNIAINIVAFRKGESPGAPTTVTNAQWTNLSGASTGPTLAKGETKHVEFTWTVGAAGNWTIKVNVTDSRVPPQKLADGTVQAQVEVSPAGWKTPALYGGIAVVIVGIPALLFVRRRMKARAEEGGEEEAASGRLTRRRRAERRKQKEEEEKEEK